MLNHEVSQQIFIGADHRGFKLKQALIPWLEQRDYQVHDAGNSQLQPGDDYVDFALVVAQQVAKNQDLEPTPAVGIIICGSGVGANVVANKVKGIRASVIMSPQQAHHARARDKINVISLAADYLSLSEAQHILTSFLTSAFQQKQRDLRRLQKIADYEAVS